MNLITLEPDMNIEPGHQLLVLSNDTDGRSLARLLLGSDDLYPFLDLVEKTRDHRIGQVLRIPHDHNVDRNIVTLIDALAHVRFSAPGLVQLTLTPSPSPEGRGGNEPAP